MELKRYLMVLLRRWWLILITLVVAVAATGVFTYLASPKYETTIRLVVSPSQDVDQDIREQRASLDTLNKPIGTVKSRVNRARLRLQKKLKGHAPEDELIQ